MDDIEQRLRNALTDRGDRITHRTLRQPALRPQRRRPGRVVAAVAAAACVLAAVAVGLVTHTLARTHTTGRPAQGTFYIGGFYKLVAVKHAGRTVTVPTGIQAGVGFTAQGAIGLDNGVYSFSTRWTPVDGGFIVKRGKVYFTAQTYRLGSKDPVMPAVGRALGAIVPAGTTPLVKTAVSGTKADLVLNVGGYTMTLHRLATSNDPRR